MPYRDAEVKALKRIPNKYLLTVLVCKRAKQLKRGAKPLIDVDGENIFDTALKEIATGKITLTGISEEPVENIPEEVKLQPGSAEQDDTPDSIIEQTPPSGAAA